VSDQVQAVGYSKSEVEMDVAALELEIDTVALELEMETDVTQEIPKQEWYSAD
jgi:hypothetical protein